MFRANLRSINATTSSYGVGLTRSMEDPMTQELGSLPPPVTIGLARVAVRGADDRGLRRRIRETACGLLTESSGLREVTVRLRRQTSTPAWECSVWAAGRIGPLLLVTSGDDPLACVRRAVELVQARGCSEPETLAPSAHAVRKSPHANYELASQLASE